MVSAGLGLQEQSHWCESGGFAPEADDTLVNNTVSLQSLFHNIWNIY